MCSGVANCANTSVLFTVALRGGKPAVRILLPLHAVFWHTVSPEDCHNAEPGVAHAVGRETAPNATNETAVFTTLSLPECGRKQRTAVDPAPVCKSAGPRHETARSAIGGTADQPDWQNMGNFVKEDILWHFTARAVQASSPGS